MSTEPGSRDDDGILRLLRSEGMDEESRLADSLAELQTLAAGEAPAPLGALDALMANRTRRAHRVRPALIILISAGAALGLGVSTAAAVSPEFRASTGHVIQKLGEIIAPGSSSVPTDSPSAHAHHPGHTSTVDSPSSPTHATTTHPTPRAHHPVAPGGVGAGNPTPASTHKPADPGRPTDPGGTKGGGASGTYFVRP
jgi:hypothetical protein